MWSFLRNPSKLSHLDKFSLKSYQIGFSPESILDKLLIGVDNIRIDVYLSPTFCDIAGQFIINTLATHSQTSKFLNLKKPFNRVKEREEFKKVCHDVMSSAINKAKLEGQIQIDYLAQVVIIKQLLLEIKNQFEKLQEELKQIEREMELSEDQDFNEITELKEKLVNIRNNKNSILLKAGKEVFQYLIDIQHEDLNEMREANFGIKPILPVDIFKNPIFHIEDALDPFFMIEEYALLGQRPEDPDHHDTMIFLIQDLLIKITGTKKHRYNKANKNKSEDSIRTAEKTDKNGSFVDPQIDGLLKEPDNVDILFNYFRSKELHRRFKREKVPKKDLNVVKKQGNEQKILLDQFYKKLKKEGIIDKIIAAYGMQPLYLDYCPPLNPLQVVQFLIEPRYRKPIQRQLKRLKGFYGKSFSVKPLQNRVKHLKKITIVKKKAFLIQYLKDFLRYHRDHQNHKMLHASMDRVNLTSEKKILKLSRANNTLYEFLLPDEHAGTHQTAKNAILNHVIIKADVRGSTTITSQMEETGLNAASYFSLNFFDPISAILSEYGIEKVFIEGDAIILSIFEYIHKSDGAYNVARACVFATKMLFIIQQYNSKIKKFNLPILELGIGVCYNPGSPMFLFDGDKRIVISPAINQADRMSSCSKQLRRMFSKQKKPFNFYLYKLKSEDNAADIDNDNFCRYNVNGIELNVSGFQKLLKEIDLKKIKGDLLPFQKKTMSIYTGKVPTKSGEYKRLIIRESYIPELSPKDFSPIGLTRHKYYEVCINPKLYQYVSDLTASVNQKYE